MKMINKLALLSLVACSSLLAEVSIEKIGTHIGYGTISYDKSDKQGVIVMDKPKTNFSPVIEIFGVFDGIMENETLKPFISYTYQSNDDFKQQYLLVGINKYYPDNSITYYGGVYTGISSLKWKYDPLNSSNDKKPTSNALVVGLQGGLEYPINERLSLDINLKGMYHNHQTELEPSDGVKSEINFDYSTFVGIGLVYVFGGEKEKKPLK
jgi:hypothetical protein